MLTNNPETHCHYFTQVQRGINFIESNLDRDIELSAVAKAAGLSQWYFQRIFKALTNETVKTYIRSRRFANTLDALLIKDTKIIDIALAAGYESQESFTRAFKTAFNLTPNEYRKLGENQLFLKKIEINCDYLRHINQNISLEPDVYQQKKLTLVGLKTYFYSVDSAKNNIAEKLIPLWDDFLKCADKIKNATPGIYYGAIQPISAESEQLVYYAAVAVDAEQSHPEAFDVIEIPASQYAKFTHCGAMSDMNNTVNYIYSNWLLNSNYRHTMAPDLEIYDERYHPTSEKSIVQYAIPIDR